MPTYEKRRHIRIDTIIKVDYFDSLNGKYIGKGYITDIGIGGLRIETNDKIETESDLTIKFLLPNGKYFDNITGKIVRETRDSFTYLYGIRFVNIKLLDRLRIWYFTKSMFE